jgi:hypothetical protein
MDAIQVSLIFSASTDETCPMRPMRSDCSRQSSRDNRTVDGRRSPDVCQFVTSTSNLDLGFAEVTAATMASAPSSHRTKTGRFLLAEPLVNGTSATQNSPGRIVIVQPFILGCVTIQECGMIANGSALSATCAGFISRRNTNRDDLMLSELKRRQGSKDPTFVNGIRVKRHA